MKNFNLLKPLFLFIFLGLCSTACIDDDGHVPMPNPEDECRLIKGGTYDTIEYNAQGYVTKFSSFDEVTVVIYDGHNQAVKTEVYKDGELTYYYTLEYTNNLLTTITRYESEGQAFNVREFTYDSKKRMIRETYDDYFSTTYTYDNKDNLTKQEELRGGELIYRKTYENYDNHPTPYAGIKGLPGFYLGSYSKNNPGKLTRVTDDDNDGIIHDYEIEVITYTYTYNSNGYPIRIGASTLDYACD